MNAHNREMKTLGGEVTSQLRKQGIGRLGLLDASLVEGSQ